MTWRRLTALVAGATVALSGTVAIAPLATAQSNIVTKTTAITYDCRGNNAGNAPGSPRNVTVTYPESVAPGEIFNVRLEPGVMRNNSRNHARFSYDIALPDNAQLVSSSLASNAQNMGGTPSLTRVDPQSKVNQADGTSLRIWGGQSARWGTNNGSGSSGGLTVSSNTDFRFPAVDMTFRAPADPGAEINVGLAGTGPNSSASGAQIMYSGNTGGLFGSNFQNECSASANASQLTTTTVTDADYAVLPSTTRIVGGDQLADTSEPVAIRAQVSSPYAAAGNLSQGTVTIRDADNDTVLGTTAPDANGYAEVIHEFDRIPDDDPEVTLNIVAEYSGFEGASIDETIAPSSDSVVLTLTPKVVAQWVTDFTARATIGELTDDALPVTVTATFQRPGLEYPEGTTAQLYRNGEAVGEPVPMPESGTTVTFQDDVERTNRNATYRYTVELDTVRVEYDQWSGATARPATVIVRGLDDASPDDPGTGSLDIGSLTGPLEGSLSNSVGYDVAPLSGVMPELSATLSSAS